MWKQCRTTTNKWSVRFQVIKHTLYTRKYICCMEFYVDYILFRSNAHDLGRWHRGQISTCNRLVSKWHMDRRMAIYFVDRKALSTHLGPYRASWWHCRWYYTEWWGFGHIKSIHLSSTYTLIRSTQAWVIVICINSIHKKWRLKAHWSS